MKKFNTKAICLPEKHYMVDISGRIREIVEELIEQDEYFVINRARQYGKSTTLNLLRKTLEERYDVLSFAFAGRPAMFESESAFVAEFMQMMRDAMRVSGMDEERIRLISLAEGESYSLAELSRKITQLCAASDRELILMIDEIDEATNNDVVIHFLAMLRDKYINRAAIGQKTFKNVILAGVYDVKNLKLKLRPDAEHRYNSPWNIAADFDIDMSFSAEEIRGMLEDYRVEHTFAFDAAWFAEQIYAYTSGYPYLVSRLCWLLDNRVWKEPEFGTKEKAWTQKGFQRAIKLFVRETNTLYDDLNKKLEENRELKEFIYRILVRGESVPFVYSSPAISLGYMFGWLKNADGNTVISNRIFETVIFEKLVQEQSESEMFKMGILEQYRFKSADELYMDRIVERFAKHYAELYSDDTKEFLEREVRMIFLCFLKPIINGAGNYYLEAEQFDRTRTDVIVDYCGKRYVIELKIWHGESYEQKGKEQLAGYLKRYDLQKGWLISFCFNKTKEQLLGMRTEIVEGKTIVEAVV